ncbi:MAG: hypothetical protein ACJASZ_002953 [Yoonia sp.]
MNEREQIQRGKKLLDKVHKLIGDECNVGTNNINHAIRRVGRAMSPKGENYYAAGAELAEYLISDEPIDRSTRLMLAELVLGELRRSPTKPTLSASNPKVIEAVKEYDRFISLELGEGKQHAAEHHVFEELGVKRGALRNWIKIVREREAAVAEAKGSVIRSK